MQNGSTLSTRALLKQLFKKAHLSSDGGHFGRPCSICKDCYGVRKMSRKLGVDEGTSVELGS